MSKQSTLSNRDLVRILIVRDHAEWEAAAYEALARLDSGKAVLMGVEEIKAIEERFAELEADAFNQWCEIDEVDYPQ